jgi:hypothetical protein
MQQFPLKYKYNRMNRIGRIIKTKFIDFPKKNKKIRIILPILPILFFSFKILCEAYHLSSGNYCTGWSSFYKRYKKTQKMWVQVWLHAGLEPYNRYRDLGKSCFFTGKKNVRIIDRCGSSA